MSGGAAMAGAAPASAAARWRAADTALPRPRIGLAFALCAIALVAARPVAAQVEPEGFPDPGAALVDDEFRVRTREFGLDRRVEMYQWRSLDGRYERVWHGARIDSDGFAAGHENPPRMLLENRRWWAAKPTLDGRPLAPEVVRALGEWRVLRPGFSRLPANLAASFQPEGEGLGTAENPLAPRIGDLRVSWRELVLPPLAGKVELRDGVWRLAPDAPTAAATGNPATAQPAPLAPGAAQRLWPWIGAALLLVAAVVVAVRRRRHRH